MLTSIIYLYYINKIYIRIILEIILEILLNNKYNQHLNFKIYLIKKN